MIGGYYRPRGRETYRVWIPWQGKKIFINRYVDGSSMYHEEQAKRVLEIIRTEIDSGTFAPESWWGMDGPSFATSGGYYKQRGRETYRVWISWKGKKIFINKYMDEGSIYHEEQAKRVLEKIKLQLASGTFSPVSWGREKGVSFEKAWAIYEEQSRVGFERAKQREMVKEKFLLPYFTGKLLREMTTFEIQNWYSEIARLGYTLSYQRMIVMTLKAFFKFHEGSIRKLPKFPSVKLPKKEVKWLEDQQRDQVHEFILPHHLAVFKFMRITGCLLSEACNLRKETVDWNRKTFSFTNEQGKSVTSLPIIPEIDECFKTAETTADSQYVFCTARGQKYTRQVLYNVWASANRKANKKHGTPIVKLYEANRYSFSRQKFIWFSRNQQLSGE